MRETAAGPPAVTPPPAAREAPGGAGEGRAAIGATAAGGREDADRASPDAAPLGEARRVRRAGLAAGSLLLLLYVATTAPAVTFWDAGEFVTALATLGIPHPPGTPLYVLAGRAWVVGLGALGVAPTHAANLLSAAATAGAGALAARWAARGTGSGAAAVAGVLVAGAMSTVWGSATEAEVYGPALLLVWALLAAADRAGRAHAPGERRRYLALAAYLAALAVPLHLSALVAVPAAALLAATPPRGARRWWPLRRSLPQAPAGALLLAAGVLCAGLGTAQPGLVALGVVLVIALGAWAARRRPDARHVTARMAPPPRHTVAVLLVAIALGTSAALVLLVRARHDPWLDQGDPSTWARLVEVVARRQYAVAPLWPRQAPWWIQLGNLFEWADFQVALGLSPAAPPTPLRTAFTVLYAGLGVWGSRWHRRTDRRGWRALVVLGLAGSVGVAAYLNLRAGPSFGGPLLPPGALHEARERDYFFALAWWVWGMWAGMGAVTIGAALARRPLPDARSGSTPRLAGIAAGTLAVTTVVAANWRVGDRRAAPDATLAEASARLLLESAPPRAVLLLVGDNDSYPVWHAQQVLGVRRDVVPVTIPLLGAPWYRAELARRHGLVTPGEVDPWPGEWAAVATVARGARRAGRPIAAALTLPPSLRPAVAPRWMLRGLALVPFDQKGDVIAPPARVELVPGVAAVDTAGSRQALAAVARSGALPPATARTSRRGDAVATWALDLLACARAAAAGVEAREDDRAACARVL